MLLFDNITDNGSGGLGVSLGSLGVTSGGLGGT
jgi:hypothetical protein